MASEEEKLVKEASVPALVETEPQAKIDLKVIDDGDKISFKSDEDLPRNLACTNLLEEKDEKEHIDHEGEAKEQSTGNVEKDMKKGMYEF